MTRPLVTDIPKLLYARREALRFAGYTQELRDYLRRHRIDLGNCIAHAGFLNIALVKFWTGNDGDETFSFTADGVPAAVIEAILIDRDGEPATADLVAWPVHDPEAFTTVMGVNDGADVLGPVAMLHRRGAPLRVHRHPLAWLQAGCTGCVPLTPGARHWLIRAGGPFIADDVDHGRELRDLIGAEAAMRQRILVQNARKAVAA